MPDTHAVMNGALPVLCICAHFPKACGYKPIVAVNQGAKIKARPVKPSKLEYFGVLYYSVLEDVTSSRQKDKQLHRRVKIGGEVKV